MNKDPGRHLVAAVPAARVPPADAAAILRNQ